MGLGLGWHAIVTDSVFWLTFPYKSPTHIYNFFIFKYDRCRPKFESFLKFESFFFDDLKTVWQNFESNVKEWRLTNKVQSATMRATNAVRILIAGFCLVLTPLAGTYVKLVQVSNTFMFYSILDFFPSPFLLWASSAGFFVFMCAPFCGADGAWQCVSFQKKSYERRMCKWCGQTLACQFLRNFPETFCTDVIPEIGYQIE